MTSAAAGWSWTHRGRRGWPLGSRRRSPRLLDVLVGARRPALVRWDVSISRDSIQRIVSRMYSICSGRTITVHRAGVGHRGRRGTGIRRGPCRLRTSCPVRRSWYWGRGGRRNRAWSSFPLAVRPSWSSWSSLLSWVSLVSSSWAHRPRWAACSAGGPWWWARDRPGSRTRSTPAGRSTPPPQLQRHAADSERDTMLTTSCRPPNTRLYGTSRSAGPESTLAARGCRSTRRGPNP